MLDDTLLSWIEPGAGYGKRTTDRRAIVRD
jgi:hypothetical protein